jgi:hypothetical protein
MENITVGQLVTFENDPSQRVCEHGIRGQCDECDNEGARARENTMIKVRYDDCAGRGRTLYGECDTCIGTGYDLVEAPRTSAREDTMGQTAAKKHYHVLVGSGGGYMPGANYYAETLRDAQDLLRDQKEQFLDDSVNDDERHRNVYGSLKDRIIVYVDKSDPYDLGEYAEIATCTDDCDPDAEY